MILQRLKEVILLFLFRLMRDFCHDLFQSLVMVVRLLFGLILLWLPDGTGRFFLLAAGGRLDDGNTDRWH